MFEHLNRQRKQKNWKILNHNFNEMQQQPQFNRSSIVEPTKKYCPRKDLSKQRIFSKSKQRLNQSGSQNSFSNSFYLKGLNKQTGLKQNGTKNVQNIVQQNKEPRDIQVPRTQKHHKTISFVQKSLNTSQLEVQAEYQTCEKINNRNSAINSLNNSQICQILNSNKLQAQLIKYQSRLYEQINQNRYTVIEIKQQFETFKSLIITELNEQKEFLRQTIHKIMEKFEYTRSKMRQQIYAEFQAKHKPLNNSKKQSRKISTEIKLEKFLQMKESNFQPINSLQSPRMINIQTFGIIQQPSVPQFKNIDEEVLQISEIKSPNDSEVISEQNHSNSNRQLSENVHQSREQSPLQEILEVKCSQPNEPAQSNQRFCTQTEINQAPQNIYTGTKQLRTYKSSGNFIASTGVELKIKEKPPVSRTNATSQYTMQSPSKSVISSKKIIQHNQEGKRYSQILKKQYEQKSKASSQFNKLDKEKINDRINHLSKFQGAMQKLKSQIMEFKTISDTKDLKKIKFSDQRYVPNY